MAVVKLEIGGMVGVNCYLYIEPETKKTVIIDPGEQAQKITGYIEKNGLVPVSILLTHAHFDHIMAVPELKDHFDIPIAFLDKEAGLFSDANYNFTGSVAKQPIELEADVLLTDNSVYDPFGGWGTLKVLHTPGHTSGSACFYSEENGILFSGDTLFNQSVGRTDLYTGDMKTELSSIKNILFALPGETIVYPGHGDDTQIGFEKENNMFAGKRAGH